MVPLAIFDLRRVNKRVTDSTILAKTALFADLWPQMGLKLHSNPPSIPILYFWFCAVSEYVIQYSKSHLHCIPENIPETTPLPPMFPIRQHDLLEDPPFIIGCVLLIFHDIIQLKPPFIVDYPMFPMIFPSKSSFMADVSSFFRIFP